MSGVLTPQLFSAKDNNGNPLVGGQLFTYAAGTSTPQATYTDATLGTANPNPVVLNARGEAPVWLMPNTAYKLVLQDAFNNTLWTLDQVQVQIPTTLTQLLIGQLLYPQSAAEIAANVVPLNYWYPPLLVDRYATNTTPGSTDMTAAWQAAIAVAAVNGGVVTCLQAAYLISSTLTINAPVSIDGGNPYVNYVGNTSPGGAIIYAPALNATILSYGVGSRFVKLENINIQGSQTQMPSGLTSQVGVAIGVGVGGGAHGIRMRNVAIINCGLYGLNVVNSVSGTYQSLYISGITSTGIVINNSGGGAVTSNHWYEVGVSTCGSIGIDVNSTGGGFDTWYGLSSEVCNYGIVFESGVQGQRMLGVHTERNTSAPIYFKSGSNYNIVECETTGASESLPLNSGGTQNFWLGSPWVSGTELKPIFPRCIQRLSTSTSTAVTGSSLPAMANNSTPTTGEGKVVLTQAITNQNTGTHFVCRATGFSSVGTTGQMFVVMFAGSTCIAATAIQATANTPYTWALEAEYVSGTQNNVTTFTVNVGSSTSSDSITLGGTSGSGYFASGAPLAQISVEEYLPSS